jgi:hypothetical protein
VPQWPRRILRQPFGTFFKCLLQSEWTHPRVNPRQLNLKIRCLNVTRMFAEYSLHVPCMFPTCSLHVHRMFTECSLYVPCVFPACSQNVHRMLPECRCLNVHRMFTGFSLNFHWMFTECSQNVPLMPLPECSQNVPWMFPECSLNVVAWMFPECFLNVSWMFQNSQPESYRKIIALEDLVELAYKQLASKTKEVIYRLMASWMRAHIRKYEHPCKFFVDVKCVSTYSTVLNRTKANMKFICQKCWNIKELAMIAWKYGLLTSRARVIFTWIGATEVKSSIVVPQTTPQAHMQPHGSL